VQGEKPTKKSLLQQPNCFIVTDIEFGDYKELEGGKHLFFRDNREMPPHPVLLPQGERGG
jgi:hypothetical protein